MSVLDFGDFGAVYAAVFTCSAGWFNWFSSNLVSHVMEVPVDNAVATVNLRNAITLLRFEADGDCDVSTVRRDFLETVSGPFDYRFTRVYSPNDIAYTMTRGVVLADLRHRKVQAFTVIPGLDGWIERFEPLEPDKRSFVFQCEDAYRTADRTETRTFVAMRFDTGKAAEIGRIDASLSSDYRAWFVFDRHVFFFDRVGRKLDVFDADLRPTPHHPLSDALNEEMKAFPGLLQVVVHPSLPIAILIAEGPEIPGHPVPVQDLPVGVYVLRWTERKGARLARWFDTSGSPWGRYTPHPLRAEFSPDGKWLLVVVAADGSDTRSQNTPWVVNERYPIILPFSATSPGGSARPIKLLTPNDLVMTAITSAWTRNPTAYVTANDEKVCRWNFDDLAQAAWVKPPKP